MNINCFDRFPEPVFYIVGGQLRYCNPAALALEPEWTAGSAVPDQLNLEPDDEGVFSCELGGTEFQASVTREEEGVLLVLRHAVEVPRASVLSALPSRLRELLNSLEGAVQMLTPVLKKTGDGSATGHLAVVQQSVYRLLRLIRHMEMAESAGQKDFSQVENLPLDLAEICRETAYGVRKLAEQSGVTLREDVPGGVIASAGDRLLLEVLLLELLSNAMKAARKGGEVGIRLTTNGRRAQITVWDNGPGMSQADLTAVMDGDAPDSLPKPGTGLRLGLPIARYAAAAHDGAVLLESREGSGMRVTVSLPLRKAARGSLGVPRVRAEESFSPLMTLLSDALPSEVFEE